MGLGFVNVDRNHDLPQVYEHDQVYAYVYVVCRVIAVPHAGYFIAAGANFYGDVVSCCSTCFSSAPTFTHALLHPFLSAYVSWGFVS